MTILDLLVLITVGICLVTDLRSHKIYNKVLLPALVLGLVLNVVVHGLPGLGDSLVGLAVGIGLLLIPFLAGGIGAGDVKLLGVIGLIKGPAFVWQTFLLTALAGGVIALGLLARRRLLGVTFRRWGTTLMSLFLMVPRTTALEGLAHSRVDAFPYGIAISVGTVMAFFIG